MTSYIVDTERFEVARIYRLLNRARYDMSDFFSWFPNDRYRLFEDQHDAYEYWESVMNERPERYEGRGLSENMLFDMFDDWLNDAKTID